MARYLVLIGNSEFKDGVFDSLECVKKDIVNLKRMLGKYGDYSKIEVLLDKQLEYVKKILARYREKLTYDDDLFVYISGHGLIDINTNKLNFVFTNTDLEYVTDTSLKGDELLYFLKWGKAGKKVLILDCCFSGAFANQMLINEGFTTEDVMNEAERFSNNTKETFIITSSRDKEVAIGDKDGSLFTKCLIEGIETGFDNNKEYIFMQDIWTYIATNFNGKKRASRSFSVGEEIAYIAKNPRYSGKPDSSLEKPICRIFISCTHVDLADYYKSLKTAIDKIGQEYGKIEYITNLEDAVKAYINEVKNSDLFIGIYAWKYGYIPKGSNISIIEQEYNYARELRKPCLCYFVDEEFGWNPKLIEINAIDELNKFKSKVLKEHIMKRFKEPETLENNVIEDLSKWLSDNISIPDRVNLVEKYREVIENEYSKLNMVGVEVTLKMDDVYILSLKRIDSDKYFVSVNTEDLLTTKDSVSIITGEPGTGKTTMLCYLALKEARNKSGHIPIFIRLSDFVQSKGSLEEFLIESIKNYIKRPILRDIIQNKSVLVLLDGFDEVPDNGCGIVIDKIKHFTDTYKNNRIIITSCKVDFLKRKLHCSVYQINELAEEEIRTFIDKRFDNESDFAIADSLKTEIERDRKLKELAHNPFLLSIICFVFKKCKERRKTLPVHRAELYS